MYSYSHILNYNLVIQIKNTKNKSQKDYWRNGKEVGEKYLRKYYITEYLIIYRYFKLIFYIIIY